MPDGGPPIGDAVKAVLTSPRCSVTLPAGAGKTELIAAAVGQIACSGGTSLVLTHTHAGVDALRRRMKKFGVGLDQVVVRTIDSWSYDLIAHFPVLAGLDVPPVPDWSHVGEYHRSAARATRGKAVQRMLRASYSNLFIDEYQDCLGDQHELACALANTIPTVVLGDPLQSLFNFGRNQPVVWETDVLPTFPAVEVDYRPRRWDPDHQDLGAWLVAIRENLLAEEPIDLRATPVRWVQRTDPRTFVATCYASLNNTGSIAVLGRFRADCVNAASSFAGRYTVMEALDEKVTVTLASKIDSNVGGVIAEAVAEFAVGATSGLAAHIPAAKRRNLGAGGSFTTRNDALRPAYEALVDLRRTPSALAVRTALLLVGEMPGVSIYCREAWDELTRSLEVAHAEEITVTEAIQKVRSHARVMGRRQAARVVSRPLLAKGLEYDHVIVLDPSQYSAQELYVALTRGSKSVTVISPSAVLPAARIARSLRTPITS